MSLHYKYQSDRVVYGKIQRIITFCGYNAELLDVKAGGRPIGLYELTVTVI
jgi:hypothetical protein